MTALLNQLSELLTQNLWIGLLLSFLAGIVTSLTPCSLSSLPLVIGYMGGRNDDKKSAFKLSLFFAVGMTITLTAIGLVAGLFGKFLNIGGSIVQVILGFVMVVMCLQTWNVINLFKKDACGYKATKFKGKFGAVLTGALGAVIASPCATPVLVTIVAVIATKADILFGVFMLLLYSIGHSILIVIAGTSVSFTKSLMENKKFQKVGEVLNIVLGVLMLALGLYLLYSGFAVLF